MKSSVPLAVAPVSDTVRYAVTYHADDQTYWLTRQEQRGGAWFYRPALDVIAYRNRHLAISAATYRASAERNLDFIPWESPKSLAETGTKW